MDRVIPECNFTCDESHRTTVEIRARGVEVTGSSAPLVGERVRILRLFPARSYSYTAAVEMVRGYIRDGSLWRENSAGKLGL